MAATRIDQVPREEEPNDHQETTDKSVQDADTSQKKGCNLETNLLYSQVDFTLLSQQQYTLYNLRPYIYCFDAVVQLYRTVASRPTLLAA